MMKANKQSSAACEYRFRPYACQEKMMNADEYLIDITWGIRFYFSIFKFPFFKNLSVAAEMEGFI
jgi:hypothetical protein